MNASPSTPASPAFRRWRRAAGILLFLLVSGATLFALFHAVENWRGQRAWTRYQQQAAARGDTLDFRTLTPAEIPDTENFAANALVDSWFAGRDAGGTDWWPDTFSRGLARIRRHKSPERQFTDLVAWKEALGDAGVMEETKITPRARTGDEQRDAARAVLTELKVYEPALDELRGAMPRPDARYPINYLVDDPFTILLPHLPKVKAVAQVLNLRACASLAAGDIASAYQDTLLGLRMADSLRGEMFIISQLVRVACLGQALQPIWEGIAQGKWSDAQLQTFQAQLASIDLVSALDRSLRTERSAGAAFMQQARKRGFGEIVEIFAPDHPQGWLLPGPLSWLMPRGWFDMEQVSYCTLLDLQKTNAVNLAAKTIDVAAFDEGSERIEELLGSGVFQQWRHHRVMARLILPALGKASRRYAFAQVQADQALLACAIERYRLTHGKLPESLETLAPRFLIRVPHDVLSGKPFTCQRDGDRFVLSSVGAEALVGEKDSGRPGEWQWHSAPR